MPNTSSVPTLWNELMIATATIISISDWYRRGLKPDVAAISGSMHSSRNGRRHTQAIAATTRTAAACHHSAVTSTPSRSPNRMLVRSPLNLSDRDVIITPSASIPAKNRPMAVSLDSLERLVMTDTPPIITTVPATAPRITGNPSRIAVAMPGSTPCARASATNARPRSTTNVPTTAQLIATSTPARRARIRNSLSVKGRRKVSFM